MACCSVLTRVSVVTWLAGVSDKHQNPADNRAVFHWRAYMEYFLIKQHQRHVTLAPRAPCTHPILARATPGCARLGLLPANA